MSGSGGGSPGDDPFDLFSEEKDEVIAAQAQAIKVLTEALDKINMANNIDRYQTREINTALTKSRELMK